MPDNWLALPYEVVHAPGFAMWATPAMQKRLDKLLRGPSVLTAHILAEWKKVLPTELLKELSAQPLDPGKLGSNLVVLTPDNRLLGHSSFGVVLNTAVALARAKQPARARLALLVGLVATAFEEPDRIFWRKSENGTWKGDDTLPRVMPRRYELQDEHGMRQMKMRETILRIAMLRALPDVVRTLPSDAGPDSLRNACAGLADWLFEELFPVDALKDGESRKGVTEGRHQIFTRDLLAYPRSIQTLAFDRAGEPEESRLVRLLHAIVRARLTPDRMLALLMELWGIEPLDPNEANRLKTSKSRAQKQVREAARTVADPGDL
jgi:hypothetical protein